MNELDRQHTGAFPSTHWSSIAQAVQESKDGSRDALSRFLVRYIPVLKTYLVRFRHLSAEEAEEYVQGFIADRIVEKEILARADRKRGRFRSFLLVALNNYISTGQQREKQMLRRHHLRMQQYVVESLRDDPALTFNFTWAQSVVEQTLGAMRAECRRNQRMDLWKVFEGRVLIPARDGAPPTSYEQLVDELGLKNPIAATNLLVTAKRTYSRILRRVIAEYAVDSVEVDAEIHELRAALAHVPAVAENALNNLITLNPGDTRV